MWGNPLGELAKEQLHVNTERHSGTLWTTFLPGCWDVLGLSLLFSTFSTVYILTDTAGLYRTFFCQSVQSLSRVWLFATPWTAARQASPSITNSQSPPKPMSIESVMPSNYLNLCRPLVLLPSIFPSIRVFSNELTLPIRWPKYWSFSISPSNEYSGSISFRIDWLDLLAVQGILKSLLQNNSKASVLQCSAFFMVQLSHPYMTTAKTIALTRHTPVSKMMPPLFTMLSRLVIVFLPRSKCLLISWLQPPCAGILEPKKIKSLTLFIVYASVCYDGTGCHDFSFLTIEF